MFRLEWDSKASISGGRRSACSEAFRRDRRGEPGGNGEDGEASLRTRRTSQTLPVLIPKTSALMQVYVLSEERLAGCVGDCKLTGIGLAAHPQPCPDKSGTAVATGAKQSLSTSCRNTCSNSSLCSVILIRVALFVRVHAGCRAICRRANICNHFRAGLSACDYYRPCLPSFPFTPFRRKL